MKFIRDTKCLISIFIFFLYGCKPNNFCKNEDIKIYSEITDHYSNLHKVAWYNKGEIPRQYQNNDSQFIYLKYKDSIKNIMDKKAFYTIVDDTLVDCNNEMKELQDSFKLDKSFANIDIEGDLIFKKIILNWKPTNNANDKICIDQLKTKLNYSISNKIKTNENDYLLNSISFSKVLYAPEENKAVVYIICDGGFFLFMEKNKNKWVIKHSIVIWFFS